MYASAEATGYTVWNGHNIRRRLYRGNGQRSMEDIDCSICYCSTASNEGKLNCEQLTPSTSKAAAKDVSGLGPCNILSLLPMPGNFSLHTLYCITEA